MRPVCSPALPQHSGRPPTLRGCSGPQLQLSCTTLEVCLPEAMCCPQEGSWGHAGPMGATDCAPGAGPAGAWLSPYPSCAVCWCWLRLCSNISPSQLPAVCCAGPAPAALSLLECLHKEYPHSSPAPWPYLFPPPAPAWGWAHPTPPAWPPAVPVRGTHHGSEPPVTGAVLSGGGCATGDRQTLRQQFYFPAVPMLTTAFREGVDGAGCRQH